MVNINKISFPVSYKTYQINEEQFLLAIEKLMQKFEITEDRAIEIAEDIIKAMIAEHKDLQNLEHEINGLSDLNWHFLREMSIQNVIEKYLKLY
ncbi:MAG: hypothetical protein WC860_09210 [Candidatus Margulisiibacteriota bacterium]|jgi:hypothetical protein